jgi:hypothetical protein
VVPSTATPPPSAHAAEGRETHGSAASRSGRPARSVDVDVVDVGSSQRPSQILAVLGWVRGQDADAWLWPGVLSAKRSQLRPPGSRPPLRGEHGEDSRADRARWRFERLRRCQRQNADGVCSVTVEQIGAADSLPEDPARLREGIEMNTYDPLSHTVYVHLAAGAGPRSRPSVTAHVCKPLPTGYANRSWPTRLTPR